MTDTENTSVEELTPLNNSEEKISISLTEVNPTSSDKPYKIPLIPQTEQKLPQNKVEFLKNNESSFKTVYSKPKYNESLFAWGRDRDVASRGIYPPTAPPYNQPAWSATKTEAIIEPKPSNVPPAISVTTDKTEKVKLINEKPPKYNVNQDKTTGNGIVMKEKTVDSQMEIEDSSGIHLYPTLPIQDKESMKIVKSSTEKHVEVENQVPEENQKPKENQQERKAKKAPKKSKKKAQNAVKSIASLIFAPFF